jgi:hypothetical protein
LSAKGVSVTEDTPGKVCTSSSYKRRPTGKNGLIMIALLVLLFPFALLAFLLMMERVEKPLDRER